MNRPEVIKGKFVHFDPDAAQGRAIPFQYNPETLKRTVTPGDHGSPAKETIEFTLLLDASDMAQGGSASGIYPALSALESLVQQPSGDERLWERLGLWESRRAFTLFVWGVQRIVPVSVLELLIHEQMFDTALNPVRASIDVTLETLSDADLRRNRRAKEIMDSYRSRKDALVRQSGSMTSLDDLLKDRRLKEKQRGEKG